LAERKRDRDREIRREGKQCEEAWQGEARRAERRQNKADARGQDKEEVYI
jgi:hypothetical protein